MTPELEPGDPAPGAAGALRASRGGAQGCHRRWCAQECGLSGPGREGWSGGCGEEEGRAIWPGGVTSRDSCPWSQPSQAWGTLWGLGQRSREPREVCAQAHSESQGEVTLVVPTWPQQGPCSAWLGEPGLPPPCVLAAAGPAGNRARKQGATIRASLPVSHRAGSWATTSPRAEASRNSSHAHLRLPGTDPKLPSDGLAQQGSPRPQVGRPTPQLPFISCKGSPGDCRPAALGPMSSVICPSTHWYKTGLWRWRGAGLHSPAPHHSPPHKACVPGPVTNPIGGQGAEQTPCPQRRGQRCRPVQGLVPGHMAFRPCPSALVPIPPSPGSLSAECHRFRWGVGGNASTSPAGLWGWVSGQTRLSRLPGT